MKRKNRNLLTVTAIAAALLLAGCGAAGTTASIGAGHDMLAENNQTVQLNDKVLVEQEFDKEDNIVEYEYTEDGVEFEVEVDAATGAVVETESEPVKETEKETSTAAAPKTAANKLTLEEAKAKAIQHAGVDESTLYDVSAELDDGVYEIEFSSKGTEYNYKISKTSEILKNYTEVDDDYIEPTVTEKKNISKSKAKSIALDHAGVSVDDIRGYEIELEDGVYEISFEKGKTEYEYEINAATGEIIKSEKEIDD